MTNRLKVIRVERGMSITELARRTGLSRVTIYDIEKGQSDPLGSTIQKISDVLDKNPSDIFFGFGVIQE